MDEVRYERIDAAAVITIDRPARRNAVDGPTAARLEACFAEFEGDPLARVLILTGAGDIAFCAGADLTALATFGDRLDAPGGPMGVTRRAPSKPTIAAIGGWCLAGGLELALWCDLRIAAASARLGFTERRFGVPLIDGGTQRLPRIVGMGRALDLILTGRIVETTEALAMGLITEVAADGDHLTRALAIAQAIAAFPQPGMLADRRAALEGAGLSLADGLALEAEAGPEVFASALRGAARFAGGEGRGGAGAGV